MTCVNCENDGAQLYKRISDGKEVTLCLCPACYNQLYPDRDALDIFTQFLGNTGGRRSKACPSCGTTLGDFRRTGLLGCGDCYDAFREELIPSIRYFQRDVVHRGKQPADLAGTKYDLVLELVREQTKVKAEIDEAFRLHQYERLKELRITLKKIEENLALAGRSS